MARDLTRINELARNKPKEKFTSIYHFVTDLEQLRASYEAIDGSAAPGVDRVTKEEYGKDLERNLQDLSERLKEMSYRPKPVKRVHIPKPGSDKKLVQLQHRYRVPSRPGHPYQVDIQWHDNKGAGNALLLPVAVR